MSNAHGNTAKDIRKWLRQIGVKPTLSNVERIGREVRRGESRHEQIQKTNEQVAKELGHSGTVTPTGHDAHKVVREIVKRELDKRDE
jgi:hypothetical protein